MADQDQQRPTRGRATVHNLDRARGIDAASRRDSEARLPTDVDPRADGRRDLPEAARRIPGTQLVSALEALTEASTAGRNASFAVLQELRRGRKYREQNPARLELAGAETLGHCEQCGAWLRSFDELVHHQFTLHVEIFAPQNELAFESERCLCSSCSPDAFGEWCREQPESLPLPKIRKGKPKATKGR